MCLWASLQPRQTGQHNQLNDSQCPQDKNKPTVFRKNKIFLELRSERNFSWGFSERRCVTPWTNVLNHTLTAGASVSDTTTFSTGWCYKTKAQFKESNLGSRSRMERAKHYSVGVPLWGSGEMQRNEWSTYPPGTNTVSPKQAFDKHCLAVSSRSRSVSQVLESSSCVCQENSGACGTGDIGTPWNSQRNAGWTDSLWKAIKDRRYAEKLFYYYSCLFHNERKICFCL